MPIAPPAISLPVLPPASRAMPPALAGSPLSESTSPMDGVLDLLFCGSLLPIPFRKVAMCLLLLIRMRLWLYHRQWAALFVFGILFEPGEQCPTTGGICSQIKKAAILVVKHSSVRSCCAASWLAANVSLRLAIVSNRLCWGVVLVSGYWLEARRTNTIGNGGWGSICLYVK